MRWALGGWRARRPLRLPGPRRGLARRRGPAGAEAAGAAEADGGGPVPFSASKASPRVWSVSRSMGSDHERPWGKVLPLSLLCAGLLLWCVFRDKTEIDERLEAVFSDRIVDPVDVTPKSSAALQPQKEK
ncbi:ubiquinol-cytochrome c reductase complex assembly factor 4 [Dromaius novaehollandiae]|uniref:ubiquinol-cytochrome c reductase complex assembly factor 4 n=1 Tax=Dromaius novaehollandiae TaxID=8790 RepID=UPI00311FE748